MSHMSISHPSHVFSHCPRCGNQSFVFDNEKKFTCNACQFNYYINASAAVAVILRTTDGKIVLTKRKYEPRAGMYDLPGGFVDTMERVEDAVKREIKEELGIEVTQMTFLASFPNEYVFKDVSYFTVDLAFICPISDVSTLKPADDVATALVIDPKDIDFNTISFPSIVSILRCYMDK